MDEGVLIKVPREHCLFSKATTKKRCIYLCVAVTDEQMDKIHAYLAKILGADDTVASNGKRFTIIQRLTV